MRRFWSVGLVLGSLATLGLGLKGCIFDFGSDSDLCGGFPVYIHVINGVSGLTEEFTVQAEGQECRKSTTISGGTGSFGTIKFGVVPGEKITFRASGKDFLPRIDECSVPNVDSKDKWAQFANPDGDVIGQVSFFGTHFECLGPVQGEGENAIRYIDFGE